MDLQPEIQHAETVHDRHAVPVSAWYDICCWLSSVHVQCNQRLEYIIQLEHVVNVILGKRVFYVK